MKLTTVTTDLETYWDDVFTLKKLTPIDYVYDPRFEVQSAATKIGAGETIVTFGLDETQALYDDIGRTVGWDKVALVGHNMAQFDAIILAKEFKLNPRLWCCTLAMARPIHGKSVGGSLRALAEHYGLQAKGDLEATNTKGLRLAEFTPTMRAAMVEYNKLDTNITYELFKILRAKTPVDDMLIIDRLTRMLVEPRFEVDVDILDEALLSEQARKREILSHLSSRVGGSGDPEEMRSICRSAPKFKELLETLGVAVPMKEGAKGPVPAFAKTDPEMAELLESEDEMVRTAVETRMQVQSSYFEGRAKRFLSVQAYYGGKMPIALKYCGALQTARLSGDFKLNQQNLARVDLKNPKPTDSMRKCLCAPKGHLVVVADLSGIEMRINHFLWGVEDSMRRWRADREADLYKPFAADHIYHVPLDEVTKAQRFTGKVAQLQLGYRSGAGKLQNAARVMSGGNVLMSEDEAKHIVKTWRAVYRDIVQGWYTLDRALQTIHDGNGSLPIDQWGLCVAEKGGIRTPKWKITYPQLHLRESKQSWKSVEWVYKSGRKFEQIHGGKITENLCQHLAGQVLKDAWALYERDPISRIAPVVHQVHDELILIAPTAHAQEALDTLQDKLRTPPTWWPELITFSSGGMADNYGDVDK